MPWPPRPAVILALLPLLGGCAGQAPRPGLGAEEVRRPVDAAAAPWRSLGLVQTTAGARCTGAVVGTRTVLTAAHCMFHPVTGRPMPAEAVRFRPAASEAPQARPLRVAAMLVGPGFTARPGLQPDPAVPPDADWALLLLEPGAERPAGDSLPLAAGFLRPGTPVALGGYQIDRPDTLVADEACAVLGYGRDPQGRLMLHHSCAGTRGASGGPILARRADGGWVIGGVTSLAQNEAVGGWAVPSGAIQQAVQRQAK
jgi:protease YdgD